LIRKRREETDPLHGSFDSLDRNFVNSGSIEYHTEGHLFKIYDLLFFKAVYLFYSKAYKDALKVF
jgi:hypothetical protein